MIYLDHHEPVKLKQIELSNKTKKLKVPSKETRIHWIYATNKSINYYPSTEKSGKWLIFTNFEAVDNIWNNISDATEKGLLGDASKVSTKLMRRQKKSLDHVICVYTYYSTDLKDMDRIKKELEKLIGGTQIYYKTNRKTLGY